MEHWEIEHKFIVAKPSDVVPLLESIKKLRPLRSSRIDVTDTYFTSGKNSGVVLRYRCDEELQQLTVKTLLDDAEVRREVNLELGFEHGDQSDAVAAFCRTFGCDWSGSLTKSVHAFYFADCEIVYYLAQHGSKQFRCLEIEAVNYENVEQAMTILNDYECKLDLVSERRCRESLFELLFPEQAAKLKHRADQKR